MKNAVHSRGRKKHRENFFLKKIVDKLSKLFYNIIIKFAIQEIK